MSTVSPFCSLQVSPSVFPVANLIGLRYEGDADDLFMKVTSCAYDAVL